MYNLNYRIDREAGYYVFAHAKLECVRFVELCFRLRSYVTLGFEYDLLCHLVQIVRFWD
jgi:hypothetical protein